MPKNKRHHITWEIQTTKSNKSPLWARVLGYTKNEIHIYTIEVSFDAEEGDSIDSMLESFLGQIRGLSNSGVGFIRANNGVKVTKMVKK